MTSVKRLEKKSGLLQDEKSELEIRNEELMRMYKEQKTLRGNSVRELLKSVVTSFIGMAFASAVPFKCMV